MDPDQAGAFTSLGSSVTALGKGTLLVGFFFTFFLQYSMNQLLS